MLGDQNGDQTSKNSAPLGAPTPNKHRRSCLSDTPLRALGAGRSQVQILSPRLTKALHKARFLRLTSWSTRLRRVLSLSEQSDTFAASRAPGSSPATPS